MTSLRLDGGSEDDSAPVGGADANAQFWIGAANAGLPYAKNLGALTTGLVINTAGVPSIATLVGLTLVGGTLTAVGEVLTGTANEIVKTGTVLSLSPVVTGAISTLTSGLAATVADISALGVRTTFLENITINAGNGLIGGGILGSNPTMSLVVGADDSSITVSANGISVSSALQAAIAASRYDTVQNNGSSVTQRSTINLSTEFTASDVGGKTAVALATAGVGLSKIATMMGLSVLGTPSASLASPSAISGAGNGVLCIDSGGTTLSFTQISSGHINSAAVTYAKIQNVGARSLMGRSANSSGVPADIAGAGASTVLHDNGTTLAFRALVAADLPSTAVTPGSYTNLNATIDAQGRIIAAANGSAGSSGYATVENNGSAVTQRSTINLSTEFTASDVSTKTALALTTAGVGLSKLVDLAGLSVLGRSANSTGVMAAITAVTDGHPLRLSGTTLGFGTLAAGAFANNTITGARLASFTADTFPVGVSGGGLGDSPLTQASNVLKYTVSASGTNVGIYALNSNTGATSTCRLEARVAGTATGNAGLTLGITGGSDWTFDNVNASSDRLEIARAGVLAIVIDPAATFNKAQIFPGGSIGVSMFGWGATGNSRTGSAFMGFGLGASNYLSIGPDTSGAAGRGVAGIFYDGTTWQNAFSYTHVGTAGAGLFKLMENGGNAAIGAMAAPTSANLNLLLSNGTAPGATPSGGAVHWAASGAPHFMGTDGVDNFL